MRNRRRKTGIDKAWKERFLQRVSDEICDPLSDMVDGNEKILQEGPGEPIAEYARQVQSAGRILTSMIDDILDFTQMEAGTLERKSDAYAIYPLLEEMSGILEEEAKKRGLMVLLNIEKNLPPVLQGDGKRVRRVLMHLIIYSVCHTKEGKITLSAQGLWDDKGRFALRLSIADTGDGEGLDTDFLIYLTEYLGGELKIQSVPEKGALISVRIPQEIVTGAVPEEIPEADKNSEKEETWEEPSDAGSIDRKKGIAYCDGNEEMYREILEVYVEQGEKYSRDMAGFQKERDWKSYEVLVHAIKSNSRSIGASSLSEEAQQQELAAKEGREEQLLGGWESLYQHYQKILKEAADLLEELTPKETASEAEGLTAVSREEYQKACRKLLDFIQAYEMNEALSQIEELKKIRPDGDAQEAHGRIMDQIKDAVDGFDYDGAEQCLLEWIEAQEA